MKMVSMERTEAEKKAAEERMKSMDLDGPDYPWGLGINLGTDELKKIGIDALPEIGAEFRIVGVAKVTNVSSSADEQDERRCVGLQIMELGMEADTDEPTAASRLYGEKGK